MCSVNNAIINIFLAYVYCTYEFMLRTLTQQYNLFRLTFGLSVELSAHHKQEKVFLHAALDTGIVIAIHTSL